ncbi:MAG: SusC/RagA family TonB-linked outer membrane protein, partial [Bacteroidota bacterium]
MNHLLYPSLKVRLLIVSCLIFYFANAQQIAYTVPMISHQEQYTSLIDVLDKLEQDLNISFDYDAGMLQGKTIKASQVKDVPNDIEVYLNNLLQRYQLQAKRFEDNTYVIYFTRQPQPKKVEKKLTNQGSASRAWLPNIIPVPVSQRTQLLPLEQTISGKVTDLSTDEPLPGVNILAKGTATGTVTDVDGNYRLTVTEDVTTLVYSSIGFETVEEDINGRTTINLALSPDIQSLSEVVVVGYGTQKKKDLTGAVATLKTEDFAPGTNTNAAQLLTGAAAGVNVSQVSSAPGGGIKVQIRGAGSINSSNDVLFVVDGLPGVDPNSLSPDDIESIEVLKDASAAAIYGTRAANGVVLITTKQGKSGVTTLTYGGYIGTQAVSEQLDVLGGADYMRLINLRSGSPTYSDEEIRNIGDGTDWQDEIFTRAPIQNHQLSMSGGGDKGNYYIGLNYFDQQGIVKSSSTQKYNARVNVQTRPIDKLQVSTSINFTR